MRLVVTLFFLMTGLTASAGPGSSPEKVLMVRVDDFSIITVGKDTVGSDQLARYIQERLFKSYMGTGKMHDKIILEKLFGGAPEPVMEVVVQEIKQGQQKALQELCLQKFRKTFEMLDKKKQGKLKKQFPVLFQSSFL